MSVVALITSILPVFTVIPVFLKMALPDGLRYTWTGFNMFCVLLRFILSIIGIRQSNENEHIRMIAMWIYR